jgi:hypothetical protein
MQQKNTHQVVAASLAALARHPEIRSAFTRRRRLPLPAILPPLLSMLDQPHLENLDGFRASVCDCRIMLHDDSDRTLAKAREPINPHAVESPNWLVFSGANEDGLTQRPVCSVERNVVLTRCVRRTAAVPKASYAQTKRAAWAPERGGLRACGTAIAHSAAHEKTLSVHHSFRAVQFRTDGKLYRRMSRPKLTAFCTTLHQSPNWTLHGLEPAVLTPPQGTPCCRRSPGIDAPCALGSP